MASKCVHKGCGKAFSDQTEPCTYHPGPPEFHEGTKGMHTTSLSQVRKVTCPNLPSFFLHVEGSSNTVPQVGNVANLAFSRSMSFSAFPLVLLARTLPSTTRLPRHRNLQCPTMLLQWLPSRNLKPRQPHKQPPRPLPPSPSPKTTTLHFRSP